MRILRGLSSSILRCGCTVGVYETYSGKVVNVVDAHGPQCVEASHRQGAMLDTAEVEAFACDPADPASGSPSR